MSQSLVEHLNEKVATKTVKWNAEETAYFTQAINNLQATAARARELREKAESLAREAVMIEQIAQLNKDNALYRIAAKYGYEADRAKVEPPDAEGLLSVTIFVEQKKEPAPLPLEKVAKTDLIHLIKEVINESN